MSNFNKAIDVLGRQGWGCGGCGRLPTEPVDECYECEEEVTNTVKQLADAGLLMPDLPRGKPSFMPDVLEWETPQDSVVWTSPGGRIMIQRIEPGGLAPEDARLFALSILAAADYAEKEQDNE